MKVKIELHHVTKFMRGQKFKIPSMSTEAAQSKISVNSSAMQAVFSGLLVHVLENAAHVE